MSDINILYAQLGTLQEQLYSYDIIGVPTDGIIISIEHIKSKINSLVNERNNINIDNHINVYKYNRINSLGRSCVNYSFSVNLLQDDYNRLSNIVSHIRRYAMSYCNDVIGQQLYPYQMCVYGNSKWYSVRDVYDIQMLIDEFIKRYGDARDMVIDEIHLKYSTVIPPMCLDSIYPMSCGSDRSVRYVGKQHIVVTIRHTNICCSLAYVTWCYYVNRVSITSYVKDIIRESINNYHNIHSILDIRSLHNVIVCNSDNDIIRLTDYDTVNNICLYYNKEHVDIILHANYLSKDTEQYLHYYSKPGYTSVIRRRILKIDIDDINTLDLECIRLPCEDIILHKPMCISYCINGCVDCYIGYNCIDEFMLYMLDIMICDMVFWVHYGSGYDIHLLIDCILPYCYKDICNPVDIIDTEQSIICASFNLVNGYKLIIRDSYRLLLYDLHTLCYYFNVNNPKLDINPTAFTEDDFKDKHTHAVKYAVNDSLCLYQILYRYREICIDNCCINPLQYITVTSMSKCLFLSKYYDESIMCITVLNKQAHDYIRRSYHGGINKVFRQGLFSDIYTYDIKSSYPYSATKKLPCGTPKWMYMDIIIDSANLLPRCQCFIECFIIPPTHPIKYNIPIHIYKDSKGNDVDENIGSTYVQVIYYREVKLGLEHGYKYVCKSMLMFSNSEYILRDFNLTLYRCKHEAEVDNNIVMRHIYKSIMNSNYGSWGFNKYNKQCVRIYNNNKQTNQHCVYLEECGEGDYSIVNDRIYSVQNCNIDVRDANVALSSAIASISRIRLFKLGKVIQDMGYDIYYCDTDSIKTNMKTQPSHKMFGNSLGQACIEYDGWTNVECNIYQKKLFTSIYTRGNDIEVDIKSKGININSKIDKMNITKASKDDLLAISNDMKQCYLDNKLYSKLESIIYTSRTNKINSKPMLYEKIVYKNIKLA